MTRNGSDTPLSITMLADGIAEAYRLADEMEEAKKGVETDGRHEEEVEDSARDRAEALAAALLHLNARSQAEALSLLLVFAADFDVFISNHCSGCKDAQHAAKPLTRALRAAIGGIIDAGAKSPLLGTYANADLFESFRAH